MIFRSILFAFLLLLARAQDFSFVSFGAYLLVAVYFFVTPVRSPFFPVAHWSLVVAAPLVIENVPGFFSGFASAGFAVLYYMLQRARRFPQRHARMYFFVVGITSAAMAGKIFFSLTQENFFALQLGVGGWTFFACLELFVLWRRAFLLSFPVKHMAITAGIYALISAELFWGLSFLPIGFLNQAALMMLVFIFSLYLHEHEARALLTSDLIRRAVVVFLITFAAVLGASRWSI